MTTRLEAHLLSLNSFEFLMNAIVKKKKWTESRDEGQTVKGKERGVKLKAGSFQRSDKSKGFFFFQVKE